MVKNKTLQQLSLGNCGIDLESLHILKSSIMLNRGLKVKLWCAYAYCRVITYNHRTCDRTSTNIELGKTSQFSNQYYRPPIDATTLGK